MTMQFPNNTLLGFAIQQGAGADDRARMVAGYEQLQTADARFSYFPFTDLGYSPNKVTENLPQEAGGFALPAGSFVVGAWAEGPLSIIPRLSNRLGWLLLAATGDVESVADTMIENLTEFGGTEGADTGINSHIFRPHLDDKFFTPWLTLRRLLPHTSPDERPGEIFQDGRIRSLTISGASAAPVTLDLDLVARVNQNDFVFNRLLTPWTGAFDNFEDFAPTSCDGWFRIGSTTFKVTAASFALANNTLQPKDSLHIGSLHPLDFPVLSRTATINARITLEDYDLYVSSFAGTDVDFSGITAGQGQNVSCTIYRADVDLMFASQTLIGATSEPNRLRVVNNPNGDNVSWTVSPIRVQPGRPVVLQVTGNVEAAQPTDYPFLICLQNGQASYALPTWR